MTSKIKDLHIPCEDCGSSDAKERLLQLGRVRNRRYFTKHKEKIKERNKIFYRNNPLHQMVRSAKQRSKERGYSFDISPSDLEIPSLCPVLKLPLEISHGLHKANSPSLDRIDNSKGYVKGNIAIISRRANILKRDASLEEIQAIYKYMKKHSQKL